MHYRKYIAGCAESLLLGNIYMLVEINDIVNTVVYAMKNKAQGLKYFDIYLAHTLRDNKKKRSLSSYKDKMDLIKIVMQVLFGVWWKDIKNVYNILYAF